MILIIDRLMGVNDMKNFYFKKWIATSLIVLSVSFTVSNAHAFFWSNDAKPAKRAVLVDEPPAEKTQSWLTARNIFWAGMTAYNVYNSYQNFEAGHTTAGGVGLLSTGLNIASFFFPQLKALSTLASVLSIGYGLFNWSNKAVAAEKLAEAGFHNAHNEFLGSSTNVVEDVIKTQQQTFNTDWNEAAKRTYEGWVRHVEEFNRDLPSAFTPLTVPQSVIDAALKADAENLRAFGDTITGG
jgi:hypothetical protein